MSYTVINYFRFCDVFQNLSKNKCPPNFYHGLTSTAISPLVTNYTSIILYFHTNTFNLLYSLYRFTLFDLYSVVQSLFNQCTDLVSCLCILLQNARRTGPWQVLNDQPQTAQRALLNQYITRMYTLIYVSI